MLPAEGARVDRLLCRLGCCRHLRTLAGSGKSQSGCPRLDSAGCVKASPVYKCPVTPGQKSRQLEEESVSSTVAQPATLKVIKISPREVAWENIIANCSFKMELAYLGPLLKVAILQRSAGISDTESCRNLCKDHNWFLKYYQRFYNPESLKKNPTKPKTICCFVGPIVLKHIVMSSDIFSMRIIC